MPQNQGVSETAIKFARVYLLPFAHVVEDLSSAWRGPSPRLCIANKSPAHMPFIIWRELYLCRESLSIASRWPARALPPTCSQAFRGLFRCPLSFHVAVARGHSKPRGPQHTPRPCFSLFPPLFYGVSNIPPASLSSKLSPGSALALTDARAVLQNYYH